MEMKEILLSVTMEILEFMYVPPHICDGPFFLVGPYQNLLFEISLDKKRLLCLV